MRKPLGTAVMPLPLLETDNPLYKVVWSGMGRPLDKDEIMRVAPVPKPWYVEPRTRPGPDSAAIRRYNAGRVRFLVENGWDDNIQLYLSTKRRGVILDGYHRLAAAFYLNLETVMVDIFGDLDLFRERFPKVEVQIYGSGTPKIPRSGRGHPRKSRA
jgi:hypothetical protein